MKHLLTLLAALTCTQAMSQEKEPEANSFKDIVKNPELLEDISKALQEAEDFAEEAKGWNEAQIAAATHHFVLEAKTSRQAHVLKRALHSIGPRTHPCLLALLQDAKLHKQLTTPTGTNQLPESPFNRICDLLRPNPPEKAIPLLAPFLTHQSELIRKDAILVIGSTGAPGSIPHLRSALRSKDQQMISSAMMGLDYASSDSRLQREVARAIYPEVRAHLHNTRIYHRSRTLYLIDPGQALKDMTSKKVLQGDLHTLSSVLDTLTDHKAIVPREKLTEIINRKPQTPPDRFLPMVQGNALHLLGMHKNPEDNKLLEAQLGNKNQYIAEGAGRGLISYHGLDGFEERIWAIELDTGYAKLNPHQRHYSAVCMLDAEVNNGGFDQYFFNSFSEHWHHALAGLEAMQATEQLKLLRKALAHFGPEGPSKDRHKRQNQLAEINQKNEDTFGKLDDAWYDCKTTIDIHTLRYVLTHRKSFR